MQLGRIDRRFESGAAPQFGNRGIGSARPSVRSRQAWLTDTELRRALSLFVGFQIDPGERIALRVAKSLSRCASGEKRDPTILMPSNPSLNSSVRRVRVPSRSPTSGNASQPDAAPRSSTPAPRRGGASGHGEARPGNISTSPVNSPGWCSATGAAPTIARRFRLHPSRTTKKKTHGPLPGTRRREVPSIAPAQRRSHLCPTGPWKAISRSEAIFINSKRVKTETEARSAGQRQLTRSSPAARESGVC